MFTESYINEFLINIDDIEQSIYRIFPYFRFKEILVNKELVLVNPRKWEDPFENFFMNSECYGMILDSENILIDVKRINTDLQKETIYGQSWTLYEESDALWRIYSSNENWGVKVKTTIKKLFTAIKNSKKVSLEGGLPYMGKVSYLKIEEIKNYTSSIYYNSNVTHSLILNPLLIKREEFCHEREVRLLYTFDHTKLIGSCEYSDLINSKNKFPELLRIKINPQDVFDEIVFDPRISLDKLEIYIEELNSLCNLPIFKSHLYEAPAFKYGMPLRKMNCQQ